MQILMYRMILPSAWRKLSQSAPLGDDGFWWMVVCGDLLVIHVQMRYCPLFCHLFLASRRQFEPWGLQPNQNGMGVEYHCEHWVESQTYGTFSICSWMGISAQHWQWMIRHSSHHYHLKNTESKISKMIHFRISVPFLSLWSSSPQLIGFFQQFLISCIPSNPIRTTRLVFLWFTYGLQCKTNRQIHSMVRPFNSEIWILKLIDMMQCNQHQTHSRRTFSFTALSLSSSDAVMLCMMIFQ